MPINVQFVYGAGLDGGKLGEGLRSLREKVIDEFKTDVFVPRIIDYLEYDTLKRLVGKWKDPTILIGHSCGVQAITMVAVDYSMKPIPYMMGIATSMYCRPKRLPPNVLRATEIMAFPNCFNPSKKQLILRSAVNEKTAIDVVQSHVGHVESSGAQVTHDTALHEIKVAISNAAAE